MQERALAGRDQRDRRQPLQDRCREQEQEREPDHELRKRRQHEQQELRGVVEGPVAAHGGERPDQHRERDRDPGRQHHERERVLRPVGDDRGHRVAARERNAEIAVQNAPGPVGVLGEQGLVEAELLAQRGELVGRRRVPEDRGGRVARERLRRDEHEHRDPEQDQHAEREPLERPAQQAPLAPGRRRERQGLGRRILDGRVRGQVRLTRTTACRAGSGRDPSRSRRPCRSRSPSSSRRPPCSGTTR